jgi:PEP-CTERM motif
MCDRRMLGRAGRALPLVLGFLIASSTAQAAPILLDFTNIAHNDTAITNLGPVYTDQGFQLTLTAFPGSEPGVQFLSSGALRFNYSGEPSIYAGTALSHIELSRVDGGMFSLDSIDLAELPNGQRLEDGTVVALPALGPFSITFTGITVSGQTVSTTAVVNPFPSLLTFDFPKEFHNLVSVSWQQGPGGTTPGLATHQFSDIRVTAVPEPATGLLLLGGVAAVTASRRRRSVSSMPRTPKP